MFSGGGREPTWPKEDYLILCTDSNLSSESNPGEVRRGFSAKFALLLRTNQINVKHAHSSGGGIYVEIRVTKLD